MTATATAPTANGTTAIAPATPAAPPATRIVTVDSSQFENMLDTAKFEHMWRVAKMYSESKLVPQQYQGDAPSCWIACQMAVRLGVDPFMFMQNTYVVQGKPGMEAKLAIALVNTSGIFDGPIQWKLSGEGMDRSATAFAVHAQTRQICECTVSMRVAESEGWLGKSGSKWKTMPDQMLRYRSAAWFARLYCPERIMGMQTADEIEDTTPARHVENTARGAAGLTQRLAAGDIIDDPRPTVEERPQVATGEVNKETGEVVEPAADKKDAKAPRVLKATTDAIDGFCAKIATDHKCELAVARKAFIAWLGSLGQEMHELNDAAERKAVLAAAEKVDWTDYLNK